MKITLKPSTKEEYEVFEKSLDKTETCSYDEFMQRYNKNF